MIQSTRLDNFSKTLKAIEEPRVSYELFMYIFCSFFLRISLRIHYNVTWLIYFDVNKVILSKHIFIFVTTRGVILCTYSLLQISKLGWHNLDQTLLQSNNNIVYYLTSQSCHVDMIDKRCYI